MTELDVAVARWLVSPDGLAAITATTRYLDDADPAATRSDQARTDQALTNQASTDQARTDQARTDQARTDGSRRPVDPVATVTFARGLGLDAARAAAVVAAATARRRARARWHDADRLVFTRGSLEQASDPDVSAWRAERYTGHDVHDLCAGVGGDTLALARVASHVTAVDVDAARLVLLAHNAACRDVEVTVVAEDALTVRVPSGGAVHADPARRRAGRRVHHLDDHVPAVTALLDRHAGAAGVGIVVAPGAVPMDDDGNALDGDSEVAFVQRGDQLLEAVLWRGALREDGATASATLLPGGHRRVRHGRRGPRLPVGPVGDHLVGVAPAAVRARLHDDVGAEVGARRLAARRALLTCDGPPPRSPWYRARPVLTVQPARTRAVRAWLRHADAGPVEIATHGLAVDVAGWWRALGRPPRGPGGTRIELVRLDHGAVAVVTDDGPPPTTA